MQKGQMCGTCMGISAERSNAWEVHGRCTGGGGDKCRKVTCTGGVLEVVGISAERSNALEVRGRWWG